MDLCKAIKPVIDTKRGPNIGFQCSRTKTCTKKRACSISWYDTVDFQLNWRSFFIPNVKLDRSKIIWFCLILILRMNIRLEHLASRCNERLSLPKNTLTDTLNSKNQASTKEM